MDLTPEQLRAAVELLMQPYQNKIDAHAFGPRDGQVITVRALCRNHIINNGNWKN